MEPEMSIKCENLTKTYKNGNTAIDNISLELKNRKAHVIIGPNGAGKSTLLRILSTEILQTSGKVSINGYDTLKDSKQIRTKIGVMPQQAILYKQLTVWEHIYYFTILKGLSRKYSNQESKRVLKLLKLYDRKNEELSTLSEGMLKAVNLSQALSGDPKILFLDEPTTGIDPERRKIFWEYIHSIKKHKTIILTTQYLDEANDIADDLIIINKGKVIHRGEVDLALGRLDYELKIEIPNTSYNASILKEIGHPYVSTDNNKIHLWVTESRYLIEQLLRSNIDFSDIKFSRPLLEEAYLNIIEQFRNE